jgi:hypothetical protein
MMFPVNSAEGSAPPKATSGKQFKSNLCAPGEFFEYKIERSQQGIAVRISLDYTARPRVGASKTKV